MLMRGFLLLETLVALALLSVLGLGLASALITIEREARAAQHLRTGVQAMEQLIEYMLREPKWAEEGCFATENACQGEATATLQHWRMQFLPRWPEGQAQIEWLVSGRYRIALSWRSLHCTESEAVAETGLYRCEQARCILQMDWRP